MADAEAVPRARVFQSPKYIQQQGALARVGEFVAATFPDRKTRRAALITSARLKKQYFEQLCKSISDPGGCVREWGGGGGGGREGVAEADLGGGGGLGGGGDFVAATFPDRKTPRAALITSARLKKQHYEQLCKSIIDPGVDGMLDWRGLGPLGPGGEGGGGAATFFDQKVERAALITSTRLKKQCCGQLSKSISDPGVVCVCGGGGVLGVLGGGPVPNKQVERAALITSARLRKQYFKQLCKSITDPGEGWVFGGGAGGGGCVGVGGD
jgi:hypothetical protein